MNNRIKQIILLFVLLIAILPFSSAIDQNIKITENVSLERGGCWVFENYTLSSNNSEIFNLSYVWMSVLKGGVNISSISVGGPSLLQFFINDLDPDNYYIFVNQDAPIINLNKPINYDVTYFRENCFLKVNDSGGVIPIMKTVDRLGINQEFNITLKPIEFVVNLEYNPEEIYISYLGFPIKDIMNIPISLVYFISENPFSFGFQSQSDNNLYSFLHILYGNSTDVTDITQRDKIDLENEIIERKSPIYFSSSSYSFFYDDSKERIHIYYSEEPQRNGKFINKSNSLTALPATPSEKINLNKKYCGIIGKLDLFPFRCIKYLGNITILDELPLDYPSINLDYLLEYNFPYDFKLKNPHICIKYIATSSFLGNKSNINQKERCEDQRINILVNKSIRYISPILVNNSISLYEREQSLNSFKIHLDPQTTILLEIKAKLRDSFYYQLCFFIIIIITGCGLVLAHYKTNSKKWKNILIPEGIGIALGILANFLLGSPKHPLAFPIVAPFFGFLVGIIFIWRTHIRKKTPKDVKFP